MRIRTSLTLTLPLLGACSTTEDPGRGAPELVVEAPLAPELAALIERGRAELARGRALEAEAVFAKVAAADQDSARTRMWVLRAWMDQGRSNDTLDALDEWNRSGKKGQDLDYLYGMAFARRAEGMLAEGVTDSSVEMNFVDATQLLKQSLEADAARYHDAWLPLARAGWFTQELDTAAWAAETAVKIEAENPEAWLTRARIAMSRFVIAEGSEAGGPAAEEAWAQAIESFTRGLAQLGAEQKAERARASTELGNAWLWRQKGAEATEAYAVAIATSPATFDYGQSWQLLASLPVDPEGQAGFLPMLERARERMESAGTLQDPAAGTLLWWLGWARFNDGRFAASEEAFQRGLALAPEFTNAWFYIGLARHYGKDSAGAMEAMHKGWDADPATMVSTVANAGGAQRAFESLLAWNASQEPPRNLDAAFLAEMLANAQPDQARHWNNLGLFLRDEGERLEVEAYKNKTPEPDAALLADLYGRSFEAYQKALALTPEDPQVINDTALMLHYHLDGDLSEVEATYRRALALLEERLAQPELTAEDRARFEQTKSDIGVNLKILLEPESAEDDAAKDAAEAGAGGTAASEGQGGGN